MNTMSIVFKYLKHVSISGKVKWVKRFRVRPIEFKNSEALKVWMGTTCLMWREKKSRKKSFE